MQQIINSFFALIGHYSLLAYIVIFAVAFLESFAFIGLLIPGTVFAASVGILAAHGVLEIYFVIIAGSLGAILADLASFYLARLYGEKLILKKICLKYQPYVDQGYRFFENHGGMSVFWGRFIGLIRPVIPFIAGLLKMEPGKFCVYAVFSGILWGVIYFGAGYLFGASWKLVEAWLGRVGLILVALAVLGYLGKQFWKRIKHD
ncbi:DedA family protein [Desulfohalobiaceae bacterium Ax17]|uniref:DedA family protein n=1 Tax=Desulfovulcanus ferrireducens TaxID=2831190 RepID=UPI00207B9FA1|nr:DedA family protein [Desulfovulcanus ferrireducens]